MEKKGGKNFLDLDINKLFENNTIKEIEKIQKQIQLESEWKKVELRTLVGERYRDLIQAADTISEMKLTTESVIKRIIDIESTFKHLQDKYLIGFNIDELNNIKTDNKNELDSWIIQIKLLMDIPEYIWSAIDQKDLLKASQLFLLAQYINYSLIFELGQSVLNNKYPIVAKQWSVINHLRRIISDECNQTLQQVQLTPELAANCLTSLILMEKVKSKDLLKKLIELRCKAVGSVINNDNLQNVRQKIKTSVKLLFETVELIHICFIHDKHQESSGLIAQFMKRIINEEISTLLVQLDIDNKLIESYVPPVTKNHRLFSKIEYIDLTTNELHDEMDQFINWIKDFTTIEINNLLNLVISVKGVYNIREESISIELPHNWNNMWRDLSLPVTNFWLEFYHPLLTKRVKKIINSKWSEILEKLKGNLGLYLSKLDNKKFDYPEDDLRWFIWKDSPSDIPLKLTKSNNFDNKRSLLMKARGYSPNLVKLTSEFDENLKSILVDLEEYLYDNEQINKINDNLLIINLSTIFDKFHDRSLIQEDLQEISNIMIDNLINYINCQLITDRPKYGKLNVNLIFLGRFLKSLITICPNLNKCFTLSKINSLTITNIKWQLICDKFKDIIHCIWIKWTNYYKLNKQNEYINLLFKNNYSDNSYNLSTMISEWEKVVIEEESEDGNRIKSEILVPYQPSVCIHKLLSSISKDLNKILAHTIPKKILHQFVENIVSELFKFYEIVSNDENLKQKQAFQLLLDIKYLTLLMIPRDNKMLNDKSQEICSNVLKKIDPFDSDVFYPFIHTNVKKSVQRSLLIYGNLVPHLEQLHSILGSKSETGDSGKFITNPPGVLAVCTGAPWFSPLTVTTPTRNLTLLPAVLPEKAQRKKPVKEHVRSDSTGSTIKSGAAAFFGAMGSDWFGTN